MDVGALSPVVVQAAVVEAPLPSVGTPETTENDVAEIALTDRGATADSSLVVVSRSVFDRALTNAAVACGARLFPERAISLARRAGAMVVRTNRGEHVADCVLGADGANSLVRKHLAAPFTRSQLSVSAGFFVHGVSMPAIRIQALWEQPGYLWSSRVAITSPWAFARQPRPVRPRRG